MLHWLYPGQHLSAAVVYHRALRASVGADGYGLMLLAFPVIGLILGAAGSSWAFARGSGDPGSPPGGGGPPGLGPGAGSARRRASQPACWNAAGTARRPASRRAQPTITPRTATLKMTIQIVARRNPHASQPATKP